MKRLLLLCTIAASLAGCVHEHLWESYGIATRRAFKTQIVRPWAGQAAPVVGLDPEEAAIVLDTYRKGLSPTHDAQAAQSAPMILLPPGAQGLARPMSSGGGGY